MSVYHISQMKYIQYLHTGRPLVLGKHRNSVCSPRAQTDITYRVMITRSYPIQLYVHVSKCTPEVVLWNSGPCNTVSRRVLQETKNSSNEATFRLGECQCSKNVNTKRWLSSSGIASCSKFLIYILSIGERTESKACSHYPTPVVITPHSV